MSRSMFAAALAAAVLAGTALAGYVGNEVVGSGMSPGTRYDGAPYSSVQVPAGDPAACREACRGDLRCLAWNYRTPERGDRTSQCDLLDSVPTLVWDDYSISGEIGRSRPAPDPDETVVPRTPDTSGNPPPPYDPAGQSADAFWGQYAMEQGAEAAGDAYATWTYVAKGDGGLTRCATACAGDDKCRAFVVRSDAELAPKPQVMCELKASPGKLLRNPDAVTGLKR